MNDRTYSISELSREFACTPRALRFYEDKGILSPRRDGLTRVYFAKDRQRLIDILDLKRQGAALVEINDLLAMPEPKRLAVLHKRLTQRLAALEAERAAVVADIDAIAKRLTVKPSKRSGR